MQRHLQDLVALLLAADEADIDAALQHVLGFASAAMRARASLSNCIASSSLSPLRLALGVQRRAQEGGIADAGQLHRVLEGRGTGGGGAFLRLHRQDVVALEVTEPGRLR